LIKCFDGFFPAFHKDTTTDQERLRKENQVAFVLKRKGNAFKIIGYIKIHVLFFFFPKAPEMLRKVKKKFLKICRSCKKTNVKNFQPKIVLVLFHGLYLLRVHVHDLFHGLYLLHVHVHDLFHGHGHDHDHDLFLFLLFLVILL